MSESEWQNEWIAKKKKENETRETRKKRIQHESSLNPFFPKILFRKKSKESAQIIYLIHKYSPKRPKKSREFPTDSSQSADGVNRMKPTHNPPPKFVE